jgi:hypothetical protein
MMHFGPFSRGAKSRCTGAGQGDDARPPSTFGRDRSLSLAFRAPQRPGLGRRWGCPRGRSQCRPATPQNLVEAWGKNAAYHFVFTRQNRGKLDALTRLVERGQVKPVIGAVLPLVRMGDAHHLLENGTQHELRGKVAIDVAGGA